jgi:NAD(P)-dependent dehydrogenase (short-subunit alcohol dehydrogenase family)
MVGPRVVVVGASSHLGMATCRELARRGARVAGTFFHGEDRAALLGKEIDGFVARRLDLAEPSDVERVILELGAELGGADALVHCAAVASASSSHGERALGYDALADVDAAAFGRMFAVNVTSGLLCARAFASLARGDGSGSALRNLVLVASIDGAKSVPTAVPYATSKGAVVAMARALAKELSPTGILVNVAAPGILDAGITRIVPEDVKREYLKHTALKRFGTHEEIARSIAWLALSNTYVTGQTLMLDGGL